MNYNHDDFTLQTAGTYVSSPQLVDDEGGLFLNGDWEAPQTTTSCDLRNYELMKYGSNFPSPGPMGSGQYLHPRNRDLVGWSAPIPRSPFPQKEGFGGPIAPVSQNGWGTSRHDPGLPVGEVGTTWTAQGPRCGPSTYNRHPALPALATHQYPQKVQCFNVAAAREAAIGPESGYRFPLPRPSPTLCGPAYTPGMCGAQAQPSLLWTGGLFGAGAAASDTTICGLSSHTVVLLFIFVLILSIVAGIMHKSAAGQPVQHLTVQVVPPPKTTGSPGQQTDSSPAAPEKPAPQSS